ncbi:putative manganese-dependent inorganic diphosphatase [Alkalispirochaeta alkalica]|uniref:putative manganese-dependent inorganic diphosphatase n=1 Tax=Alkalispirochaeta alkalica TaxID=46356 RepID=UPI0003A4CB12|nr:putative manganese-dependent inorganic diphosphatase [Alkalispirochaeta alkalica]
MRRTTLERVYVAGHKNPDMDSTCAAHCYAALKQRLNPNFTYLPIRSGPLSDQIQDVFAQAELPVPPHYDTIAPTVGLVARRSPALISPDDPVLEVFNAVKVRTISSVPVIDQDSTFVAMVGVNEITSYVASQNQEHRPVYTFLVENFEKVLPGTFLRRGAPDRFEASLVTSAMPVEQSLKRLKRMEKPPLLVVGHIPEIIACAVKNQFPAIVLTGIDSPREIEKLLAGYKGSVFLSETDTAESIRMLRLSSPVSTIMDTRVPRLDADMPFDEAKALLLSSSYRGLPVFEKEEFIGIVSRRSFIERPRPKLIMVDHNELSQAVDGAEQAELLEIVDHHRLAPPSTNNPIEVTTRVVGSTCTLIYEEFSARGFAIEPDIALLLLSGIISDTVNLQSPTTTEADRRAILRLETITGISAAEHAQKLFAQIKALGQREPQEIILSDFKLYEQSGIPFGIGQVEVTTLSDSDSYRDRLLQALEDVAGRKRIDWAMLMVTDVIKRDSLLLSSGYPAAEGLLPFRKQAERTFDLPGVLSRKKQLLPEIMRVLAKAGAT